MRLRILIVPFRFKEHGEGLSFLGAGAKLRTGRLFRVLFLCIMGDLSVLSNDHALFSTSVRVVLETFKGATLHLESAQLLRDVCVALGLRHAEFLELRVVPITVGHWSLLYS